MAKRIQRADATLGFHAPGEMERALDDLTRVAPRLPRAHHARHLAALQSRDFPAAQDHLRRHFDYLAMGDEGGGLEASQSSLPVNAAAAAAAGAAGAGGGAGGEVAAAAAAAAVHASRARLQSALLTLGMTHVHFAHSSEALKALNEAVRTAQQNGDEASLAHALAAFCSLCASASVGLCRWNKVDP
jgi:anaphase-promoting complex subunit 5